MLGDTTYLTRGEHGQLFVVATFADSRDPIKRSLWWPVTQTEGWLPCTFVPESSGEYCRTCGQRADSIIHSTAPNTFALSGHDGRYGGQLQNGTRYTVHIDPRGQAVKVENVPIPCPKVRAGIDTRYTSKGWQKYLKSSGWQTIS